MKIKTTLAASALPLMLLGSGVANAQDLTVVCGIVKVIAGPFMGTLSLADVIEKIAGMLSMTVPQVSACFT